MAGRVHSRRGLLGTAGAGLLSLLGGPILAFPRIGGPRKLKFLNLHTGERVQATYWDGHSYQFEALQEIDRVLRDHRTGEIMSMDRRLLDLLVMLRQRLDSSAAFHVISGYRSPKTNAKLAARSGGVAKKSLHTRGMAIDIRLPDRSLADVRRAALALKSGGVGYYPKSDFVHVDVGRVRRW